MLIDLHYDSRSSSFLRRMKVHTSLEVPLKFREDSGCRMGPVSRSGSSIRLYGACWKQWDQSDIAQINKQMTFLDLKQINVFYFNSTPQTLYNGSTIYFKSNNWQSY